MILLNAYQTPLIDWKNLYKALSKSDYEFFWISAIKTKQQTQVG